MRWMSLVLFSALSLLDMTGRLGWNTGGESNNSWESKELHCIERIGIRGCLEKRRCDGFLWIEGKSWPFIYLIHIARMQNIDEIVTYVARKCRLLDEKKKQTSFHYWLSRITLIQMVQFTIKLLEYQRMLCMVSVCKTVNRVQRNIIKSDIQKEIISYHRCAFRLLYMSECVHFG